MLGFSVTGPNGVRDPDIARNVYHLVDSLVPQYDAFQDNPWPVLYRYLDQKYPGNKFILTIRDPASWMKSQLMHFDTRTTPMREWIYGVGSPKGNESIYISRFERHNAEVLEYFKDRKGDLLVMDFSKGDGWQQLCPFLRCEPPDIPFPHLNKASDRQLRKVRKKSPLLKHAGSLLKELQRITRGS